MLLARFLVVIAASAMLVATPLAHADLAYFEGFEDPAYTTGGVGWHGNGGTVTRALSGASGIDSSSGVAHGVLSGGAPYTLLGGYSSVFGGGYIASMDVFIDPGAFSDMQGFDYSVAISNQAGGHLRDFIWHVGMDGADLKVNASNNTDAVFNAYKLNNNNGGVYHTISTAGWYTFEQVFYDDGGTLSVDFNLYDDNETSLFTATNTTTDDIALEVGGNRYGWFTYNDISGLAIDNVSLTAVPEPTLAGVWALGSMSVVSRVGRRRRDND